MEVSSLNWVWVSVGSLVSKDSECLTDIRGSVRFLNIHQHADVLHLVDTHEGDAGVDLGSLFDENHKVSLGKEADQ